jgi:hypothetical protein
MLHVTYPMGTLMDAESRFEFHIRYIWAVKALVSLVVRVFCKPTAGESFVVVGVAA